MTLRFERARAAHAPAVRAFNARLDASPQAEVFRLGVPHEPGAHAPEPAAAEPADAAIRRETYFAVDGDDVRGGVMLQHQAFALGATTSDVANIQLPLSEGTIDRRFSHVGMWLIKHVVQRHPLAFAVGMGSLDRPLPKLLAAMGWTVATVPFLFRVHRASRFLRRMPRLQGRGLRTAAAHAAAWSGAGWVGLRLLEARRALGAARSPRLDAHPAPDWGDWADDVWRAAGGGASVIGVRDRRHLEALYPPGGRHVAYRLAEGGRTVGWTVVLRTQMRGSAHFGDLVVGTVLDALALPGYEGAAARTASRALGALGVDLSLANHAHAAWRRAFRDAGYLEGPSNYVLAMSRQLARAVDAAGGAGRAHVTRGDGDGRIHL